MRNWIKLIENHATEYLYHGTSASNLHDIYEDGLTGPSYWGTNEIARDYMHQYHDGVMICLPINRFSEDGLMPNEHLYASLNDEEDENYAVPQTWEESLEACESVVYEYNIRVTPSDIQDRLTESVDLPMDSASRKIRAHDMGFTTAAYHGTGAKFNEFDMDRGASNHSGFAPFFASEKKEAKGYADSRKETTGKGHLMSVLLRARKPLVIPSTWAVYPDDYETTLPEVYKLITGGKLPHETKRERYLTNSDAISHMMDIHYQETGNYDRKQIWRKIYDRLIGAGYDSIIWKDVRADHGDGKYDKIVMLDMSGIRLTSAKFDPSKADSRDLRA